VSSVRYKLICVTAFFGRNSVITEFWKEIFNLYYIILENIFQIMHEMSLSTALVLSEFSFLQVVSISVRTSFSTEDVPLKSPSHEP
jgi:hypothetical protein